MAGPGVDTEALLVGSISKAEMTAILRETRSDGHDAVPVLRALPRERGGEAASEEEHREDEGPVQLTLLLGAA